MIRSYNITFAAALLALNFYMLSRLSFVLEENKILVFSIGILILFLLAYLILNIFLNSKKENYNKELVLQHQVTVLTNGRKINFFIKIGFIIFTCVLGILTYYNNV